MEEPSVTLTLIGAEKLFFFTFGAVVETTTLGCITVHITPTQITKNTVRIVEICLLHPQIPTQFFLFPSRVSFLWVFWGFSPTFFGCLQRFAA